MFSPKVHFPQELQGSKDTIHRAFKAQKHCMHASLKLRRPISLLARDQLSVQCERRHSLHAQTQLQMNAVQINFALCLLDV